MRRSQRGFALLELAIAAAILTLGAIWMATRISNDVQDAGARATARYLLSVKGAVQAMMVEHFDHLAGYPPPFGGTPSPAPPAWLAAAMPLDLSIAQLRQPRADGQPGYLSADFPDHPVYGEQASVRLWREGACPGEACRLQAIVHTTAPVRAADELAYSPELVGEVMMASEGFGGHSPPGAPGYIRGAIFNVPNPVGEAVGIVAVSASLDTTMFHQFVRQGDTRQVWLQNSLDVVGAVSTATGMVLNTVVEPGASCAHEGMYASTARQSLAMCMTGVWFELTRYVVTGMTADLISGAQLTPPHCQGSMQPFVRVALQSVDVTLDGSRIDVKGRVSGSISGSGSVSETGSVSVSGSFEGAVFSTADSRIRVSQSAGAATGVLNISDAGPQARAYAVYGCHHV
nr:prepilin-type N-terminal cleavage/methylation domain-containing protein [Pseudomonas sp.]